MRDTTHTHPCQECGQRFVCDGELFQNYDGWPEVVCQAFHVSHRNVCETCDARLQADAETDLDESEAA